jgi:hypothetical protein
MTRGVICGQIAENDNRLTTRDASRAIVLPLLLFIARQAIVFHVRALRSPRLAFTCGLYLCRGYPRELGTDHQPQADIEAREGKPELPAAESGLNKDHGEKRSKLINREGTGFLMLDRPMRASSAAVITGDRF